MRDKRRKPTFSGEYDLRCEKELVFIVWMECTSRITWRSHTTSVSRLLGNHFSELKRPLRSENILDPRTLNLLHFVNFASFQSSHKLANKITLSFKEVSGPRSHSTLAECARCRFRKTAQVTNFFGLASGAYTQN